MKLRIADLRIDVCCDETARISAGPEHAPFVVEDDSAADLAISFRGDADAPWFARGPLLFRGHANWEVFESAEQPGTVFVNRCGPQRRCEVLFSPDYARAQLRFTPWPVGRTLGNLPRAWEVACISRMARLGGGVLTHALGLALDSGGLLLPATSGSGKSTLSGFYPEAVTLSDERVAVTSRSGVPWIHGTPWRGSAGRILAASAPLRAVVFLGPHSAPYGLTRLPRPEAFRRLAFHASPPFWDRTGLARTVDLAHSVASTVPAFEVRFEPGPEVVALLAEALA